MQSGGNHGKSVQWFMCTRCWIKRALSPSSASPLVRVYFLGKFRQRNSFFLFFTQQKRLPSNVGINSIVLVGNAIYTNAAVWETNLTGVI